MTLSLKPQNIDEKTWYYEEPKGLHVVREARTIVGGFIQTEQFVIPWKMLRVSLARKARS